MTVMRYLFAAKSLGGEISIPLVGDLGVFPSWLIPLIITFNFINRGNRCRKGIVLSLTSEVVAGENNEMNYMISSFGAIGSNCLV